MLDTTAFKCVVMNNFRQNIYVTTYIKFTIGHSRKRIYNNIVGKIGGMCKIYVRLTICRA